MAFPTIAVTPGSGTTINTLPNAGQQVSSNSLPVVLASDQSPVTVSGNVSITALPAGSNVVSGTVNIGTIPNLTISALPAGANVVSGTVNIGTMPSVVLGASGNTIGTVTIGSISAGANTIGSVFGRTSKVIVNPTVTASSAYATGNIVGGLMTFANVFDSQGSGILQSVRVRSKSVQTGTYALYLFTANPSNSTWTDKTTPAINVADIPALIGPFSLTSVDSSLGTVTIYESDGISAAISAGATTLYGILIAKGTPTFTSTSDITVELTTLKD